MNRIPRAVATLITATLFFFTACASVEEINTAMNSWVGSHQSELIAQLGPPTRTATDGAGGIILIYEEYVNTGQTPGRITEARGYPYAAGTQSAGLLYTPPQQRGYTRSRMFYANHDGIIYNWRWEGL